jgi:hypothetical protein
MTIDYLPDARTYLVTVMDSLDITKPDLCEMLGVHPKTVEAWISGRRPIPVYVGTCVWLLERLARFEAAEEGMQETKH